jgi:hypothetical protein
MTRRMIVLVGLWCVLLGAAAVPNDAAIPRYSHIFLIIEENRSAKIIGGPDAPQLTELSKAYGYASNSYAVTHPSEPNYVALVSGATYGILDDDAYYCKHGSKQPYCKLSWLPFYANHTIDEANIGTQLVGAGLTWKEYLESLPAPGSMAVVAPDPKDPNGPIVYAAKHSGFINFVDVQQSARRAQQLVGFDQLNADLASNKIPNFSVIIPNLCNDMHGVDKNAPADCQSDNDSGLIQRGDAHAKALVDAIMATKSWKSSETITTARKAAAASTWRIRPIPAAV